MKRPKQRRRGPRPAPPSDSPRRAATDRQRDYLAAVARLVADLDAAPTGSDIARAMGVTREGVRPQLNALRDKGLLREIPVVVRARWALTDEGEAALASAPAPGEPPSE